MRLGKSKNPLGVNKGEPDSQKLGYIVFNPEILESLGHKERLDAGEPTEITANLIRKEFEGLDALAAILRRRCFRAAVNRLT